MSNESVICSASAQASKAANLLVLKSEILVADEKIFCNCITDMIWHIKINGAASKFLYPRSISIWVLSSSTLLDKIMQELLDSRKPFPKTLEFFQGFEFATRCIKMQNDRMCDTTIWIDFLWMVECNVVPAYPYVMVWLRPTTFLKFYLSRFLVIDILSIHIEMRFMLILWLISLVQCTT